MTLTPIAVQQRTFGTAWRGYDLDEVDDFLDEVVASLAEYERRLKHAKEQVMTLEKKRAQLEQEIIAQGEQQQAMTEAMHAAQRSAEAMTSRAQLKAEQILAEARVAASQITSSQPAHPQWGPDIDRVVEVVRGLRDQVRGKAGLVEEGLNALLEAAEQAQQELGGDSASGYSKTVAPLSEGVQEMVEDEDLPPFSLPMDAPPNLTVVDSPHADEELPPDEFSSDEPSHDELPPENFPVPDSEPDPVVEEIATDVDDDIDF